MVLASAASAQGTPPGGGPAAPEHHVTLPDWKRLPEANIFMDVYPKRARALGMEGVATMKCHILRNGRLKDCEVVSQTPPDFGFGEAELKLAKYFLMTPQLIDGKPVEAEVAVPIRFQLKVFYVPGPAPSEHRALDSTR